MGIVELELANFELSDGTEYTVELNRNGRIHIHIDTVRIDMSIDEFEHFTETISEAKERLLDVKEMHS